jgi:hypothetical protein
MTMALVILGKTVCGICKKTIEGRQDLVSFSPFVANCRDSLYQFSDAAFHRRCFHAHPLAREATCRSKEVRAHGTPGQRRCVVCAQEIIDPDDYFGTGFLIADATNPVFEFNYLHIHRSHFGQWSRAEEFRRRIEGFLSSDAWEGPRLRFDPMPGWVASSSSPGATPRGL